MRKIAIFFLILVSFLTQYIWAQAGNINTICAQGVLGDYSPFQSVPTYDYDTDGFVRFHFVINGSGWSHTNNIFYKYNVNCEFQGMSTYTYDSAGSVPESIVHLMLKAGETSSGSGWYTFSAFDEDTGQPVELGGFPAVFTDPVVSIGIIKTAGYPGYPGYREDGARTPAVPVFDASKIVVAKTPVLIVPGVLGTNMSKDGKNFWINLSEMAKDWNDQFMDPLQFSPDLTPSVPELSVNNVIGQAEMFPKTLVHYDYTQALKEVFFEKGYLENATLFTFPYDWRYGVSGVIDSSTGSTTADLLGQKVADIMQQTGSQKIDVIAHSTGGLLVKKYVMENPDNHHIGKAVFVGVPNTGAPKAIKTLLMGDGFGVPWLADGEMQKIAKNIPVVYDLMPSAKYYSEKQGPVMVYTGKIVTKSQKELNYEETNSYLSGPKQLNGSAIEISKQLHAVEFDNYDLRTAGVDLYSIVGCKSGTISQVWDFQHDDGSHVRYDLGDEIPGDGTVPLESATNLPIDQSHKFYALKADHGKMLSQNSIRQQLVNIIAGTDLSVSGKIITQDIGKCKLKGKAMAVFSPLDIEVTDSSGNVLGFAEDGSLKNQIPGADFEVAGEHKYVYLPTDENEEYAIKIKGTGNGTFTVKISDIDNATISKQIFSNIPVTPSLKGTIALTAEGPLLKLDKDGDGTVDEVVHASSVIEGKDLNDMLPPQSKALVNGSTDASGSYYAPADIAITATDTESGILGIKYSLDNTAWTDYASGTPVSVSSTGTHTFQYFATDKAGNNEEEKSVSFTVVGKKPESSGGGGGGGGSPAVSGGGSNPLPYEIKLTINDEAPIASSPAVTLKISAAAADEMMLANKADFQDAVWEPFVSSKAWVLLPGQGKRTIYARFRNKFALGYSSAQSSVLLDAGREEVLPQVLGASTGLERHGEGSLVKFLNDPTVYFIQNNSKRPFASAARFKTLKFKFSRVQLALPGDNALLLGMEM